ncbi:MAG: T9SS type A sorting domain-containing protein [Muribaculaceae bacterium]|nr:T9SS type A sorting domain-containing protein [Muribaculaceae bacterium]
MKRFFAICLLTVGAMALTTGARADGFAALAGTGGNCHFSTASALASYTANEAGAVHHGALVPFIADAAASIGTVSAAGSLSAYYCRESSTLVADACSPEAIATVVALDGRTVLCGTMPEGVLDLGSLAPGIYIVRVADAAATATLKIVR